MISKKQLISNMRSLQSLRVGGEPNSAWLRSTRERLMSEIRTEMAPHKNNQTLRERLAVARILLPHRLFQYVAKPVMVSGLVLGMALGGWVTTVSASFGTLPGDALYGVKIATENAQVTLTPSAGAKAKLKVEFVGRRVDEVSKIVENPGVRKAERVSTAVKKLKEDMTTVQSSLEELRGSQPEKAVEVAKLIDRKAEEFQVALSDADVPDEVKQEVREAKALVVDTSVKAVALLVETRTAGTDADVKERVGDKINSISVSVTRVAERAVLDGSSSSTPSVASDAALVALGEAQVLLDQNDIDGALSKVIKGNELAQVAENIATKTSPAASEAPSSSSSTPATVLPVPTSTTTTTALPSSGSVTSTPAPLPTTTGSSTPR